jgi:hypothetical protein
MAAFHFTLSVLRFISGVRKMMPDLSKMEELQCPDCKSPLLFEPYRDDPSRVKFVGCRCKDENFTVVFPRVIHLFGPAQTGPLFVYGEIGSNQQIQKTL